MALPSRCLPIALVALFLLGLLNFGSARAQPATVEARPTEPFRRARFVVEPAVFLPHSAERSFIGPGTFALENGELLMAAPWGRPPTNFEQLAATHPVPPLYRSRDGGRTWQKEGGLRVEWTLPGMISDGGISFLRLQDGRLALLAHRHVAGLHGGGLPAIAFSQNNGETWTPARLVGEPEGVWYVMNDRLIQLRSGRLIVPVAHVAQRAGGYIEGDRTVGLCFFSDDGGKSWTRSRQPATLDDKRGMAEPAVAEIPGGQLLMLARTGSGFLYASRSADGGETWSSPQPTTLLSACSSLTLKTLPDGRLIVFYNHVEPIARGAFFPRTPLCYAVSSDHGQNWGPPVIVDDEGVAARDRQNIYPSAAFTREGMVLVWSSHQADPRGSFAGQYTPNIGGGKRAIIAYPEPAPAPPLAQALSSTGVLRILPLGDSITRGTYLDRYESGPYAGQAIGLASPNAGGYRKPLQDRLRQAGIAFDFVGDLSYYAYGTGAGPDPAFDPDHQGLAGFSNQKILDGGVVPTPKDVLAALNQPSLSVQGIRDVLARHRPDLILLMSGANGFDAAARDTLIRTIGEHSQALLLVATTPPQAAPRTGWEQVTAYNQSLPATVAARRAAGQRIAWVDLYSAVSPADLQPDGVHPTKAGLEKIAQAWFEAITAALRNTAATPTL
ncbi:MAG: exo-alpha-sialidase [Opitutaceae bacterium]|nr:exo-alpha-sialidase [Opitutaceae bacterium]